MAHNTYFPGAQAEQVLWLQNYKLKIPTHGPVCGLASGEVVQTVGDIEYFLFVRETWNVAIQNDAQEATAYVKLIATGDSPGVVPLPDASTFPGGPIAVAPGVLTRIFNQVQRMKLDANYTDAIAQDLRLAGEGGSDLHPIPEFKLEVTDSPGGQQVKVKFRKFGHEGVVIESRRGAFSTPWEFLSVDSASPYVDNRPLLAPNTPETREYRLRYWDRGQAGDTVSTVATVTVK